MEKLAISYPFQMLSSQVLCPRSVKSCSGLVFSLSKFVLVDDLEAADLLCCVQLEGGAVGRVTVGPFLVWVLLRLTLWFKPVIPRYPVPQSPSRTPSQGPCLSRYGLGAQECAFLTHSRLSETTGAGQGPLRSTRLLEGVGKAVYPFHMCTLVSKIFPYRFNKQMIKFSTVLHHSLQCALGSEYCPVLVFALSTREHPDGPACPCNGVLRSHRLCLGVS